MLAGLEKVNSGSIYFGDRDIIHLHPSNRNIGLAFENYSLYPHLSVFDNIVFPLTVKRTTDEEIKKNKRLYELIDFKLKKAH